MSRDKAKKSRRPQRKARTPRKPKPRRPRASVASIAREILKDASFAQDPGRQVYVYRNGVYVPKGEEYIKKRVKEVLAGWGKSNEWSAQTAREVAEYIRVDSSELWEVPPLDVINLKNGLLNLERDDLLPPSWNHLSPIQIPVNYDPEAQCPAWEEFVKDVFPSDAQELAWEIPGYLLIPETSIQKAILLVGEGGNGKSTYLAGVTAFIGQKNISTVTLQDLVGNRFSTAQLVGRLANVCPDLPTKGLEDTAVFKAITGGDLIQAERKYRTAFSFRPYARLVFSANQLPQSKDSSVAFFDRWIVVPFDKSFRGTSKEKPRSELDAQLADPKEQSGLLNKALAALKGLTDRGSFSEAPSTRKALQEFQEVTDHLAVFMERKTVEEVGETVPVDDLRSRYNEAARNEGRPVMTNGQFGKAIKRLRPNLKIAKRGAKGQQQRVYEGIRLKSG